MDSSHFPHLAAGEIAFRGYVEGAPTDAYASASAILAAHNNLSDTFMATAVAGSGEIAPHMMIAKLNPGELSRLARVEAVAAVMPGAIMRKAADRVGEIAGGDATLELAASGHVGAKRIAQAMLMAANSVRRSDGFSLAQNLSDMMEGARDLASNAALSAGAVTACHDFRKSTAAGLSLSPVERQALAGSPFAPSRDLAAALEALREALAGGSLEDAANAAGDLAQAAIAAEREATRLMGDLRAADERSHAHNATVADLRASVTEWKAEAQTASDLSARYREQRDSEGARATKAEAQLARIMTELGGLTLSQLPSGAYGGALVDAYCDIKAGRT